jgi:hypothetical protein
VPFEALRISVPKPSGVPGSHKAATAAGGNPALARHADRGMGERLRPEERALRDCEPGQRV